MKITPEKSYRVALAVLLVLVLGYALAAGLRTVSDSDMGWHLATGRWVVEHHAVPSTDVLSYTAAGTHWIYPPFAGVLLYLIYLAGGYAGLSIFCGLACVATVAYLARRRDLASLVLAMCAVEAIAFRTGPRADLFNTVFLALFLGELWAWQQGASRRLWLLPLIMLFWVNLHPGFVLGLLVIGSYVFLEACELLFADRRAAAIERLRKAWPALAATASATLLNPWGIKLYSASLTLSGLRAQPQGAYNSAAFIQEFLPVPLSSHLFTELVDFRHAENGFVWLMVAAVAVILVGLWRRQPGVVVLQGAALYLGVQHARYIGLFCVATTILGATVLGDAVSASEVEAQASTEEQEAKPLLRLPPVVALVFVGAVAAVTLLHAVDFLSNRTHVVFHSESRFGVGEAAWYPERAASFIQSEQLPGQIFEEYSLGGFAAWRLGPRHPNFIDGRFDHLAPAVLVEERKLRAEPPDSADWQAAADRWGINVLLIRTADRQDALGYCQSSTWRPVYMDEVSLVLMRNTPANRAWIDRLQINCFRQPLLPPQSASRKDLYDFWVNAGGMLFALERNQEAEAALQQAAALYPYDPNARMMLAELLVREQRIGEAEAEFRRVLQLDESEGPWFGLGKIYAQQGRPREAEQAFARAAHLSVNPCPDYMALAQVELWLNRPEAALEAYAGAEASSPYRHGGESLAPRFYADIADGRAEAYGRLAQPVRAIDFAQQAVRLEPGDAARWNQLSALLAANGQPEMAQQALQQAQALQAVGSRR